MKPRTRRSREADGPPVPEPAAPNIRERREHNVGRQLLQAYRAFNALATRKLTERGHAALSTAHTSLLPHIALEGARLTAIARLAGMTKQAAAQVVQDLEDHGYIERVNDPDDRRAVLIKFTAKGWRFLQHAYEIKAEIEAEYAELLGIRGLDDLRRRLASIIEHSDGRSSETHAQSKS
jgi:DNA-binding MarR family transcriptional regulator